jgi:hypothetical protein
MRPIHFSAGTPGERGTRVGQQSGPGLPRHLLQPRPRSECGQDARGPLRLRRARQAQQWPRRRQPAQRLREPHGEQPAEVGIHALLRWRHAKHEDGA